MYTYIYIVKGMQNIRESIIFSFMNQLFLKELLPRETVDKTIGYTQ